MRFVLPLMFSLVVSVAPVYAQPSGSAPAGTTPLSPNNCGTPDQPKPCTGSKTASKSHKAAPVSHKATSKATKPTTH
jgi:hypothetical protein